MEQDQFDLCRKVSLRRHIKRFISILLILTLLAFGIYVGMIYKVYLDAKNQIITHEVTVIE